MSKARELSVVPQQSIGFKNRIINGAMQIDQRNAGASFTVGNLGYGIDRFLFQAAGATGTGQQVTGSTGNNKAIRITGATSLATIQVSQRIESVNIYDCASQTVTVSFTLYGSSSGSVSVRFLYPTATDNYTSFTEPVGGTTVNFTTTPTTYTVTRTLDANANKGVWVLLDFGAVGNAVTRTIEFFQLEKGSTATSFDYRPYGTELALCQRYFQKSDYSASFNGSNGVAFTATKWSMGDAAVASLPLACTMRTSPTITSTNTTLRYVSNTSITSVTLTTLSSLPSGPIIINGSNNGVSAGFGWFDQVGVVSISAEL